MQWPLNIVAYTSTLRRRNSSPMSKACNGRLDAAIDHVYLQYENTKLLFEDHQPKGIMTMSTVMNGEFVEDTTIMWQTNYMWFIEIAKLK